ncbi:MAG TPA: putative LPS assembly protein LptD [Cyclobacteriaceae bacterium]|nr:putative LPS assembly protein LptD [Cyclobacteriaceae bacterium]
MITFLAVLALNSLHGQDIPVITDSLNTRLRPISDSTSLVLRQDSTLSPQDSLVHDEDSIRARVNDDIETTITYNSRDSITFDLKKQLIGMFGEGKVTYGEIELTAENIHVDYSTSEITANGSLDSLGKEYGSPVFKDGDEVYETRDMRYNYKSRKAIIHGVVTKQGEAIMHGDNVKRDQFGDLFIDKAKYTTCNLPEPHFNIEATKIKVIPGDKIIAGPFYMKVHDIPLPVGFGFGMFPQPRKKASGIQVPSYGEEKRRGFYLRDGGYYFAISDYIDLLATGEIYSKGSWGLNFASQYRKMYAYNGNISIRFNKQKTEQEGAGLTSKDFWVSWSHSPQSKGTGRFSANVRAGSSTYNQNNLNYYDISNNLNQEFSSNVSYSKSFTGTPFNLGTNARIQQNTSTGVYNIQLPDISLSMNRIYPFKGKAASAKNWWQNIFLSWNMVGSNNITNNRVSSRGSGYEIANRNALADSIVQFNWDNRDVIYDRMQNGIKHSIPISTSMKLLKYFVLSPSANYQEVWYFKQLDYTWLPDSNAVRVDTTRKFSRIYNYNAGAGITTKLYGTLHFKGEKIQALRHVISPNIGISFAPDFAGEKFGYYQEVQIDSMGRTRKLSRYDGFVYGTPTVGKSATLSFGIQNNIEMKVKSRSDTSQETTKIPLLDNFGISSGYNFLADSFRLSPLNFTARTRIFNKKVDISFGWTVDPYIYHLDTSYTDKNGKLQVSQWRLNQFAWNNGKGLGQVSRLNFTVGTSLNPKATNNKDDRVNRESLSTDEEAELDFITANPSLYVDFDIPWNLRLDYSFNYTKIGYQQANIIQSIRASGDFSLTKKWKVVFNTGYDFKQKEFVQTNFNISRDLHCWQMNLSWVPFGRYQSYNVTINAKSSLLQDLKLNRRRSWYDN